MNKEAGVFKIAGLIAIVTVFSKFAGFIRDVVIAKYFGASLVSDAYFYAYQIPSISMLILGGVGGPFHSATVAVFSKIINSFTDKPSEKALKLFRTFTTLSFLFFLVIGILVFMFSDVLMSLIINGGSPELVNLSSYYLKIMSPVLVIGGIVGIYYGLLVTYNKFLLPNISPTLVSLVIVIALIANSHNQTGTVLVVATAVGALCQLLVQVPAVRKIGYSFKPDLSCLKSIELKNIGELLFPAVLSSTIGQIHIYIDMFFTSKLQTGGWTAIGYANRAFQFPLGVLVTAFLVPLFPLFAKLVAQKDYNGVKYYFNNGIGMLNFMSIPVVLLIILCGYDAVQLVFERGAFDSTATMLVSQALFYLSLGIIPYVFRDSVTRVFYSFNDSKTPFIIAACSILTKILLNYLFISVMNFGIGGITFSTSLVTLFNAALLGILIRRKIKLDYLLYFKNLLKMIFCAGLSFLLLYPVSLYWHADTPVVLILKLVSVAGLFFVIYMVLAFIFKIEFAKMLINKIFKKTE